MFCELDVVRFSAPEGGVAVVGEDAAGVPLAIADNRSEDWQRHPEWYNVGFRSEYPEYVLQHWRG